MPQGTIRKLFADKGYGFVEGERGYWFFHQSVVEGTTLDSLRIGQAVEYEEGCGPSGPRADSVRVL
jgi:CspA family cold shock protein